MAIKRQNFIDTREQNSGLLALFWPVISIFVPRTLLRVIHGHSFQRLP